MARLTRRRFLAAAGAAWGVGQFWKGATLCGQTAAQPDRAPLVTEPAVAATQAGLAFLASRQLGDGSFGTEGYRRNVAVVSLAGLALLAQGSTAGRGAYGRQVDRCIDFLLQHTDDTGFIQVAGSTSHGPMYGHGFATLFLAEAYGSRPDPALRRKLALAVRLIVNTQNDEGGWRYQPERRDADISVTVCQVMALRAARNAGLYVGSDTIGRCTDYVKRLQNEDGGFAYMLPGGESAFPRSAAGVVALYSAGIYAGDAIRRGLAYVATFLPRPGLAGVDNHFFYGHYYAAQAMWQAGGEAWARWYPAIRDTLLARCSADGSWFDPICPEYGTAMACLILQMPNNYLPIFQR